ncbi:uncharacterized protein LOC112501270 [Cynara cardunculus var. scolymus]|uniref:uncharacterized protein LOC112501270 n=1 Tax=Cynara cardunculus var. scolymus TaxID=59895 RepID=UPI000D6299B4|nr:uncharacterized protein LOC112501270 [Cynara cardunculus var. scolymus]
MVKLATARESRMYGSRRNRERSEYTNAGLYVFSTIVLLCGFIAQLSREAKSGLVVLLIGLGLIIVVNIHDLFAHLAGIDYQMRLMELDTQLLLVEVAVPVVQAVGGLLFFIAILFLVLQADRGFGYDRIEVHALNLLIASTSLWLLGSIHNSCQIYEHADARIQILQQSVHIPFLVASLLFLAGAILNFQQQLGHHHHGLHLLTYSWVWIGIIASSLLVIGGLTNVVKVIKMLQVDGIRLEKLRGGAQERLIEELEEKGETPFLIEEGQRRQTRPLDSPPLCSC